MGLSVIIGVRVIEMSTYRELLIGTSRRGGENLLPIFLFDHLESFVSKTKGGTLWILSVCDDYVR